MKIDRRRVLSVLLSSAGAAAPAAAAQAPAEGAFRHGVASGDPLQDRVVLWTRVTPARPGATLDVGWEMAEDAAFRRLVASGMSRAAPARDHTVKVDATGLRPGRAYFYRFRCGATVSPVGRTRTLPTGATAQFTLGVVTCSLYPNGFFNAYDHLARQGELDAVVHLGDYIYEYGAGPEDYGMQNGCRLGRIHEPAHELVSLADYRTRHALYKSDPDLQRLHARCPWICVWDDHEVCNDDWVGGAENHQPGREGAWLDREAAALRAYYEWMPIREPEPGRAFEAINRAFQIGDLASLIMVESRLLARSRQLEADTPGDIPQAAYDRSDPARPRRVTDAAVARSVLSAAQAGKPAPAPYALGPDLEAIEAFCADPERQMLGARQEQWLARELKASVAAGKPWQLLGNQVVMARTRCPDLRAFVGAQRLETALAALPPAQQRLAQRYIELFSYGAPYDLDGWDGYPAARERVFDAIKAAGGGNAVVLSGDSHAFWTNELHDASGRTRVAAEFGTTGVTSPSESDGIGLDLGPAFEAQNPEVKFCRQLPKGYILLTLTRERAQAQFVSVEIDRKPYAASTVASFELSATPGVGVEPIRRRA